MAGFGWYFAAIALDEARAADRRARRDEAAEPRLTTADLEARAARWRAWARDDRPVGPSARRRPLRNALGLR